MVARSLDACMELIGGIGPYLYECTPIPETNMYCMTAEEIGYR